MAYYRNTRIIPVVLTLIMIAVVIAVFVSIARVMFLPDNASNNQSSLGSDALVNTSADRSVYMIARGPIVANESFQSYQIQVTPSSRKLVTYKGYAGNGIDNISLGNNLPAYEQFVYALDKAYLMKGKELSGADNDLRGVCATGTLYEFQILKAGQIVKQLWTSTCPSSRGSLDANLDTLIELFTDQVIGSQDIINKLW